MNDPFCVLGHSSAIRDFYIPDNEHYFLSASRDKTVKLWLLKNHGNGTAHLGCSKTYDAHARAVFTVQGIESRRLVASCDGVVHVGGNLIRFLKKLCSDLLPPLTQRKVKKTESKTFRSIFQLFKKILRRFLKVIDPANICLSKVSNRNTGKSFEK